MTMTTRFHSLTISEIERLTDDALAISFDVPEDLEEAFKYLPGQYLTLRAEIDGEEVRRSYSICSHPDGPLRVGIKRIENGVFSGFAHGLEAGACLDVMAPEGRFICETRPVGGRNVLLVAAGSGITPVLSIASALLSGEPETEVTLVYGNRSTSSIMFRTEIEDLKDRFLERFHVFHVLSREVQDVPLLHGRIDVARVNEMVDLGLIQPDKTDAVYLCGPAEMTLSLKDRFEKFGTDPASIYTELFEAPGEREARAPSAAVQSAAKEGVQVGVVLDGLHRSFQLENAGQTVLQAAAEAGLDLPFSCAGGMCATCRCKIVEGDGEMDRNFSLDTWETEAGFVLACQLRPTTETLTLDFDAA